MGRSGTTSAWPPFVTGLALAAAVTMRPTNAVALVLGTILVLWKTRARGRTAYLFGVFAVFLPWILITLHYYGTPLQPYDQASKLGLSPTFFESVAAQLISPSRGLLVFSPIVLVAIAGAVIAWRRKSTTPLEILCAVAVPCYVGRDRAVSCLVGGDQLRAALHDGDAPVHFRSLPPVRQLDHCLAIGEAGSAAR